LNLDGPNGTKELTLTANDKLTKVVSEINNANTGIKAGTSVTTELTNLTETETGTLVVGEDKFDLSKYKGDTKKLAEDLGKSGYSAEVADNGSLSITAKDVDGIKVDNAAKDGVALDGNKAAAADDEIVVNAQLKLSSSDHFKISGNLAAELTGTDTGSLNSVKDIDLTTVEGSQNALDVIDAAIAGIDSQRADLGAVQNRFNHTLNNLSNINENVNASNSRIKDVDFAKETTNMTKNQILQQASTSILAQAKQIPQSALSLLG
ncbi:flagellin, partial [Photobacterium damselae subsp. damselae]